MAYGSDERFPEYVSAAERRLLAARRLEALAREGLDPRPIRIAMREIAATFWGKAWCDHIESLADLASRLPRGRAYVRSGAVLHLAISRGEVQARVSGTDLYEVAIRIAPLARSRWSAIRRACAGRIATLVELLSGKLSTAVMQVLCDRDQGLFPASAELDLACSCPDGARLCKHLAAVLYGVGARLDEAPELLFLLRGVELGELIAAAGEAGANVGKEAPAAAFTDARLMELFGIELEGEGGALPELPAGRRRPKKKRQVAGRGRSNRGRGRGVTRRRRS